MGQAPNNRQTLVACRVFGHSRMQTDQDEHVRGTRSPFASHRASPRVVPSVDLWIGSGEVNTRMQNDMEENESNFDGT